MNDNFKEVTLWYKDEIILDTEADDFEGFLHSGKSTYVFNHLEENAVPLYQEKPKPIISESKLQHSWINYGWAKQTAYLINGVVVPISNLIIIDEYGRLEFVKRI